MSDEAPATWEQIIQLARRIADAEAGDPALTAKRLALMVLDFQTHVVKGPDTPAASATRPALGVARAKQR